MNYEGKAFLLGCMVSTVIILVIQGSYDIIYGKYSDHGADHQYLSSSSNRQLQMVNNGYPENNQLNNNKPNTILLGIFSTVEEKERREKLRNYIFRNPARADPRLCSLNEFLSKQGGGNNNNNNIPGLFECQVAYTFVVGANTNPQGPYVHTDSSQMHILVGDQYIQDKEPDVVYLNIKENMNRGKTPTWFKYASGLAMNAGAIFDYVAKLDSDTLLSVPNLIHMLNHDLPSQPKNVYGGIVCDETACGDPKLCHEVLQGKVYMTGQFYFLSVDLAAYISSDKLNRDSISAYSEDVNVGMWVHSSNRILKLVILNNKNVFWIHNTKEDDRIDEKYNDYFVQLRKFPLYSFWLRPKWWD